MNSIKLVFVGFAIFGTGCVAEQQMGGALPVGVPGNAIWSSNPGVNAPKSDRVGTIKLMEDMHPGYYVTDTFWVTVDVVYANLTSGSDGTKGYHVVLDRTSGYWIQTQGYDTDITP